MGSLEPILCAFFHALVENNNVIYIFLNNWSWNKLICIYSI